LKWFLGKVNLLRRFIPNLSEKVDAFIPILRLKNEAEFTWGQNNKKNFRLYVEAKDEVIGAVLTQETEGKEYIITHVSRQLIDAEMRYTFIEKLCLSLYYACAKLRSYLLPNTCIVVCQTDVIKHILHKADFEWYDRQSVLVL